LVKDDSIRGCHALHLVATEKRGEYLWRRRQFRI
jgi:hypothetical protein